MEREIAQKKVRFAGKNRRAPEGTCSLIGGDATILLSGRLVLRRKETEETFRNRYG